MPEAKKDTKTWLMIGSMALAALASRSAIAQEFTLGARDSGEATRILSGLQRLEDPSLPGPVTPQARSFYSVLH